MNSFKNRQLNSKPNPTTKPQELWLSLQKMQSSLPMYFSWPGPTLRPTESWKKQNINFSTKFSEPKFRVHLDCEPKFHFRASPNQVLFPMVGPRASSHFYPDRDKIFQFSDTENFPDRGATTPAECQTHTPKTFWIRNTLGEGLFNRSELSSASILK